MTFSSYTMILKYFGAEKWCPGRSKQGFPRRAGVSKGYDFFFFFVAS